MFVCLSIKTRLLERVHAFGTSIGTLEHCQEVFGYDVHESRIHTIPIILYAGALILLDAFSIH